VILYMGISIDGFVCRPDGAHDWGTPPEDDALREHKVALLSSVGAHLMGRTTYEDMASAWPSSTSAIGRAMNEIPKVVFSRTLKTAGWPESRIASGPLSEEIARLKHEPGADLMAHGGATFARALTREGLVDEYRLMVQPAALGAGMPIFDALPASLHLELMASRPFATGAVEHVYRPRSAQL
jgi:dihydrofolate reductase